VSKKIKSTAEKAFKEKDLVENLAKLVAADQGNQALKLLIDTLDLP